MPKLNLNPIARRTFLGRSLTGVGSLALANLLNQETLRSAEQIKAAQPGTLASLHHPPKAKRVIHLCMAGGPSHLETFDEKPKLAEMNGKPMPESFTKGQPIAQLQGRKLTCLAPQFPFASAGESGQRISDAFKQMQTIADDICIVRSLVTEQINHDPAHTFMNTGTAISGRPSMGSWVFYGLGAETNELPGFIVMTSVGGGQSQPIAARQWHSGFLPSRYQGVQFNSKGQPVHYVGNPAGVDRAQQGDIISAVSKINSLRNRTLADPEIATRISQYELAFRMQAAVPELTDFSDEPQHVLDRYGAKPGDGSYASNCLLARRLAERGVRFIQLYHRGWDHHGGIKGGIESVARLTDKATAALINDLKQRDMLKDTLVIWGGEFGRTPMAQGNGRDHHIKGFSCWMAGGSIKGGTNYGATDEFGYNAVENVMHVHDLHATMLHLLGIDHKRMTVRYQGRDFRLTDVHGHVVKEILA